MTMGASARAVAVGIAADQRGSCAWTQWSPRACRLCSPVALDQLHGHVQHRPSGWMKYLAATSSRSLPWMTMDLFSFDRRAPWRGVSIRARSASVVGNSETGPRSDPLQVPAGGPVQVWGCPAILRDGAGNHYGD